MNFPRHYYPEADPDDWVFIPAGWGSSDAEFPLPVRRVRSLAHRNSKTNLRSLSVLVRFKGILCAIGSGSSPSCCKGIPEWRTREECFCTLYPGVRAQIIKKARIRRDCELQFGLAKQRVMLFWFACIIAVIAVCCCCQLRLRLWCVCSDHCQDPKTGKGMLQFGTEVKPAVGLPLKQYYSSNCSIAFVKSWEQFCLAYCGMYCHSRVADQGIMMFSSIVHSACTFAPCKIWH